jgi:hypothetical protein
VRDDSDAYTDRAVILNGNELRARRFQNGIVSNPNPLPNVHASRAMQRHAKATRTRQNPSQMLQHAVFETPKSAFFHRSCVTPLPGSSGKVKSEMFRMKLGPADQPRH